MEKIVKHCPFCGWPEDQPYAEVSRHRTTDGGSVWTRCVCGSVQMRTGGRIVARSRPDLVDGALPVALEHRPC